MNINDQTVFEDERKLKGWQVVLNGEWKGRDYRLFAGKTTVGSNHYANIYLPETGIEPFHFSIRFENQDVWITDLDSDSGVSIDEEKIHRGKILDETLFKTAGVEFLIKIL
jgi:pSer/pThr/pTyr-binding forkhead associated (FHA) protein